MAINIMPVPSEPRGADKRTMLRSHGLFGKLTPQHIDRLSSCIVTKTAKRGIIEPRSKATPSAGEKKTRRRAQVEELVRDRW
jgi:hypothetical protein